MDVANNFVGEKAIRKQLFGKLSTKDVPKKVSFLTKSTQTVALWTVSSRSCSTRGWVTVRKRRVAKKWKRTGEKGIWNYLTRDWFACKSWIRWVLYSLVVYPNISQVIDGSLTLLFVLIKVYVERERGNRRLRARCLTYFCYDILISIMISMLAAVRDLVHWEPVSVRFVNRNSGTEPHFLLPWLRAIFHSLQTALACC